jgi:hypothetical protein
MLEVGDLVEVDYRGPVWYGEIMEVDLVAQAYLIRLGGTHNHEVTVPFFKIGADANPISTVSYQTGKQLNTRKAEPRKIYASVNKELPGDIDGICAGSAMLFCRAILRGHVDELTRPDAARAETLQTEASDVFKASGAAGSDDFMAAQLGMQRKGGRRVLKKALGAIVDYILPRLQQAANRANPPIAYYLGWEEPAPRGSHAMAMAFTWRNVYWYDVEFGLFRITNDAHAGAKLRQLLLDKYAAESNREWVLLEMERA